MGPTADAAKERGRNTRRRARERERARKRERDEEKRRKSVTQIRLLRSEWETIQVIKEIGNWDMIV